MRTVYYNCNGFRWEDFTWVVKNLPRLGGEYIVQVVEISTPDTPELARHRRLVAEKFGIED